MQRHHWIAAALVLVTWLAFEPIRQSGFVNFDDRMYVTENPHVRGGLSAQGFAWAFNLGHASNWHPLTWFSHMLDVSLWGMNARGHHLTSVVLHSASVVLLFLLLRWMTGETGKSAFVAAAFAVHPLHVESVAWISERKDVLSTLLGLLSVWAWVGWTRKGGKGRYAASIALYGLGLMAKPMLVSLPFVLLLLDFWPLRRIVRGARAGGDASTPRASDSPRALLLEKVPFLVLAAVSCAITIVAQRQGTAVVSTAALPLPFRFENAACAYVAYLVKTLWPMHLAYFYPYPPGLSVTTVVLSALFLLGTTAVFLIQARARPWLAVGWLWWMGMLVPVIGIMQVGWQSLADRYMYMPLIGLAILAAWGAGEILSRWSFGRTASAALAVTVVGAWIVLTRAQAAVWKDDLSLFGHAIAVTERNHAAHHGRGNALAERGRLDEALSELRQAAAISPRTALYYNDIGIVLEKQGQREQAMEHYREALRLDPDLVLARGNLANGLVASGRFEEACLHYVKLLALAPERAQVHTDYAVALSKLGRFDEALGEFAVALRCDPNFGDTYLNRGVTLANMGRLDEAIESMRVGVRLRPDRAEAQKLLEELLPSARGIGCSAAVKRPSRARPHSAGVLSSPSGP